MLNNYREMEKIEDLLVDIDDMVNAFIEENHIEVDAEKLGLDRRAGGRLWVSPVAIAVCGNTRSLDYYGGFEYVDDENKRKVGNWTFYMIEEYDPGDKYGVGRIRKHIGKVFRDVLPTEEEEDEE